MEEKISVLNEIDEKTVMITGASGLVGSRACQKIAGGTKRRYGSWPWFVTLKRQKSIGGLPAKPAVYFEGK